MKATIYGQFVGGEDKVDIQSTITKNMAFGVKSILDYSAEEDMTSAKVWAHTHTIYTHSDRHTHLDTQIDTHSDTLTRTHRHTQTHTDTHTHTHTHFLDGICMVSE